MLPLPLNVCDAELRASYAAAIPDPDDTLLPPATTPTGPATTAAAAAAADPATTATAAAAAAAAAEDELIPHFKPLSYAVSVFLLLFITAIGATWCWLMYCREEEPPMPPPKEPEPPTSTYRDHRRLHAQVHTLAHDTLARVEATTDSKEALSNRCQVNQPFRWIRRIRGDGAAAE
ncbi:hypothetical protein LSAT2_011205 [Lamellibrachia satsuma]|nr:hypothetical protein LSAT2_011205 [Lamellibrachia satsuma]